MRRVPEVSRRLSSVLSTYVYLCGAPISGPGEPFGRDTGSVWQTHVLFPSWTQTLDESMVEYPVGFLAGGPKDQCLADVPTEYVGKRPLSE